MAGQRELDEHISNLSNREYSGYRTIAKRMNAGGWYDPLLIDCMAQRFMKKGQHDETSAFTFGQILHRLNSGTLTLARYHVGRGPSADRERARNLNTLRHLKHWRPAITRKNCADQDGYLHCRLAHSIPILKWSETETTEIGTYLVAKGLAVPLEIGFTEPGTTYWHLDFSRSLARWPYGHNDITVFFDTTNENRLGL